MATWVQPPNTPKADFFNAAPTHPTRAKDTIYQAGTTARMVMISLSSVGGVARFEVGAESDLSDAINCGDINSTGYCNQSYMVPPGFYYRMNANSGSMTVNQWTELNL